MNRDFYEHHRINSKHLRRRRGSFRTLCKFFFLTLLVTLFLVTIFIAVAWFVIQPELPDFKTESAFLGYYNSIPSPTNHSSSGKQYENFMVVAKFSIRNPNKKIELFYELTELESNNSGSWWGLKNVKDRNIHQPGKNTTVFEIAYDSEVPGATIVDDRKIMEEMDRVVIKFSGRLRFKIWRVHFVNIFYLKAQCDLLVPVAIDGRKTSSEVFKPTKCDRRIHI